MGKYTQVGDPRRKELVQRTLVIQRVPQDPDETPEADAQDSFASYMSLLAVVFGFMAIFFRYRAFALQSLVCCIIGIANSRSKDLNVQQILSSLSLSIMGVVITYRAEAAQFRQQQLAGLV